MPVYIFQDERDNSIHEIVMTMNEEHRAFAKDGYELKRIFVNPQMSIDTTIDPFDHKKGIQKIGQSRGTLGDMQDFAAEQSKKRSEKIGDIDPLKKKQWTNYEKTRGKKCLEERKHTLNKSLKDTIIKLKNKEN